MTDNFSICEGSLTFINEDNDYYHCNYLNSLNITIKYNAISNDFYIMTDLLGNIGDYYANSLEESLILVEDLVFSAFHCYEKQIKWFNKVNRTTVIK